MSYSKLYCVNYETPADHGVLNIPDTIPEEIIEYPSQRFINKKKPALTVYKTTRPLEDIARQVSFMANGTDPCYLSLTEFLVTMMETISDTLLEN